MKWTAYLYDPASRRFTVLGEIEAPASAPAAAMIARDRWPDADDSKQYPGRIVVREDGRELPQEMLE